MTPQKAQKRQEIANIFSQVAAKEQAEQQKIEFGDLLDKNDKKRVLLILKESAGDIFLATALFKSIRNRYPKPEWTIYFACDPQYIEIIQGNPYIDKILQWQPIMNNHVFLTGNNNHSGYFNVVYDIASRTQKLYDYYNNSEDQIDLKLTYE